MSPSTLDAYRETCDGWRPPPDFSVSEFCDEHIVLTSGPLSGAKWRTDFAPYQRGILNAFEEQDVEYVIVKSSSQVGKTSIAIGVVAFHIAHDPCSILVVEPTVRPMAEEFSRNRLAPIIDATPILADAVSRRRAKDSANTILEKTFRGGAISIGGANSAASLAARSIRLLVLDEVDRYPLELPGEGSTIRIAIKRTTAFRGQRRIMMLSTPTLAGAPIDAWHKRGDCRRFQVPCLECDTLAPYEWKHVVWQDNDPSTARLECPACGHQRSDAERVAALDFGAWVPDNPERRDRSIVSFHLWEAYSPMSSLAEIVDGFLVARAEQKAGNRAAMVTWTQTTLGEAVEPVDGEGVQPEGIIMRREEYAADAPAGVACLTMGVDVQDDRLELLVIGWGPDEESWIVHRETVPGDTSQADPWAGLDAALDRTFEHEGGAQLPISAACIDSAGHRTATVYAYAQQNAARYVYAIIGRDGQRPIVSSPSPRRWGRNERPVPLYTVGVDSAKALIVSRLKLEAAGPGCIHLPIAEWCDDELVRQLTAEKLITLHTRGVPREVWRKVRTRNDALDCAVYALAALRLRRVDLRALHARIAAGGTPTAGPPAGGARPRPARKRWIEHRDGGWMGRRR